MSVIIGQGANVERVGDVFGWLVIINDVHRQTEERLRAVLAGSVED